MKKTLSALLAALLALALIPAAGFVTVSAANASALATAINTFAHGGTGTLTATADGNEVTVTGSVTGVTNTLALDLDAGIKVAWKAVYKGRGGLIRLEGPGMFEVAAGANVETREGTAVYADTGNVTVTGGTVCMNPNGLLGAGGYAIHAVSSNVTVTGGNVTGYGSIDNTQVNAIYVVSSSLTVSGGTVTQQTRNTAISASSSGVTITGGMVANALGDVISAGAGSDVTVSGGTVRTNGGGNAIYVNASNVTVTGGTVIASYPQYHAISATSGSVMVMGGSVVGGQAEPTWTPAGALNIIGTPAPAAAAYLPGTCKGTLKVSGSGQIAEVDSLAIPACHDGTNTGLTVKAGTGTAAWDCAGAVPVIAFSNGKTMEWGEMTAHTPGPAATCTTAQTCTICSAQIAPAKGHTPGPAATCTAAQTCTVCSAVLVPATGHDYSAKQNTVAPTYDEQGYTIYKCSHCTATEKRDFTAKLTRPDPPKKIFTTRYDATFINWILFFLCFGFIWMWF